MARKYFCRFGWWMKATRGFVFGSFKFLYETQ